AAGPHVPPGQPLVRQPLPWRVAVRRVRAEPLPVVQSMARGALPAGRRLVVAVSPGKLVALDDLHGQAGLVVLVGLLQVQLPAAQLLQPFTVGFTTSKYARHPRPR